MQGTSLVVAVLLVNMAYAVSSFGADKISAIKNVVKNVAGKPFVKGSDGATTTLRDGSQLKVGDIIYTLPNSSFDIQFEDDSVVTVTSLTVMKVDELLANESPGQSEPHYQSKLKLKVGEVKAKVSVNSGVLKKFEVQTPVGTASVRGTEKLVNYAPDAGMAVNTLRGQVMVQSQNGLQQLINPGEFAKAQGMATQLPNVELQSEQMKAFMNDNVAGLDLESLGMTVDEYAAEMEAMASLIENPEYFDGPPEEGDPHGRPHGNPQDGHDPFAGPRLPDPRHLLEGQDRVKIDEIINRYSPKIEELQMKAMKASELALEEFKKMNANGNQTLPAQGAVPPSAEMLDIHKQIAAFDKQVTAEIKASGLFTKILTKMIQLMPRTK